MTTPKNVLRADPPILALRLCATATNYEIEQDILEEGSEIDDVIVLSIASSCVHANDTDR